MGQTHLIGLDFLKRPYSLTYQRPGASVPGPVIQSATYNAASQMTEMVWADNGGSTRDPDAYSYPQTYERRTYNESNQLTRIQAFPINQASTVDLNYQYTAGQNNGQVASLTDAVNSARSATYSYDSLMRLASVAGQASQSYSYDGWGNLYSRTVTGQNFTLRAEPATNRVYDQPTPPAAPGACYDSNGNMTAMTGGCGNPDFAYNNSNRLAWSHTSQGDGSSETYIYTADYKRVSTVRPNGTTAQVFYIYGAKSEIAAVCTSQLPGQAPVCDAREPRDLKFAGRIVRQNYLPATVDRLGSVVTNQQASLYGSVPTKNFAPFGEQLNAAQSPSVFPGNTGFATYWGDTSTGLNYADQRFYNSGLGRFMTADPYRASAGAGDPGSWNRYAYVGDDPVNYVDPNGLFAQQWWQPSLNALPDMFDVFGGGGLWGLSGILMDQGSAGGGSSSDLLHIGNLAKSGANYNVVKNQLGNLLSALDPTCKNFLNSGGGDINSYIGDLLSSDLLAVADYTSGIAAFTSTGGTDIAPGTAALVVNNTSAFFNDNFKVDNNKLVGGSAQAQIFILLHELGHALGSSGFQDDYGNKAAGKANDKLIDAKCQKTVRKF